MSAPFPGAPAWPLRAAPAAPDWQAALARLGRKHYQWYYSTDAAAPDATAGRCRYAIIEARSTANVATPPGWRLVGTVRRPADRSDVTRVYIRP